MSRDDEGNLVFRNERVQFLDEVRLAHVRQIGDVVLIEIHSVVLVRGGTEQAVLLACAKGKIHLRRRNGTAGNQKNILHGDSRKFIAERLPLGIQIAASVRLPDTDV